jgi:hypothetical protein
MSIHCAVSLGELIDKITILEIKKEKIKDQNKISFVICELSELNKTLKELNLGSKDLLLKLKEKLKVVNSELWDIEDRIRDKEKEGKFDQDFIELARSVYLKNDLRFEYKNEINISYKSGIREIKSYNKY